MVTHAKTVALVWGTEPPAFSIGWDEPLGPVDSGFSVLLSNAPDPQDVRAAGHFLITTVCLDCLRTDHPGIDLGFAIAREYGVADLDDGGKWVVGDLSRLADVN